jgi:hypothetical protein
LVWYVGRSSSAGLSQPTNTLRGAELAADDDVDAAAAAAADMRRMKDEAEQGRAGRGEQGTQETKQQGKAHAGPARPIIAIAIAQKAAAYL